MSVSASGEGRERCLASSSAGKNASTRAWWWWPRVPPVLMSAVLRRRPRLARHSRELCVYVCVRLQMCLCTRGDVYTKRVWVCTSELAGFGQQPSCNRLPSVAEADEVGGGARRGFGASDTMLTRTTRRTRIIHATTRRVQ